MVTRDLGQRQQYEHDCEPARLSVRDSLFNDSRRYVKIYNGVSVVCLY